MTKLAAVLLWQLLHWVDAVGICGGVAKPVAVDAPGRTWTAEIAIPLAALVLPFDVTSTWRFNLNRERQAKAGTKAEFQGLVATPQGFHSPEKFAVLSGLEINFLPYRSAALDRQIAFHMRACEELHEEASRLAEGQPGLTTTLDDLKKASLQAVYLRASVIVAEQRRKDGIGDGESLVALAEDLARRETELAALRKRLRSKPERPDDELF